MWLLHPPHYALRPLWTRLPPSVRLLQHRSDCTHYARAVAESNLAWVAPPEVSPSQDAMIYCSQHIKVYCKSRRWVTTWKHNFPRLNSILYSYSFSHLSNISPKLFNLKSKERWIFIVTTFAKYRDLKIRYWNGGKVTEINFVLH